MLVLPVNGSATLYCLQRLPYSDNIEWIATLNGTRLDYLPIRQTDVLPGATTRVHIGPIPLAYNGAEIHCQIANCGQLQCQSSNMSIFVVQGVLGPVNNVVIEATRNLLLDVVVLSWDSPVPTDAHAITYCVKVENSSSVHSECNITMTTYIYPLEMSDPCDKILFTITPVNRIGKGTSSLLPYFGAENVLQLMAVEIIADQVLITMSATVCYGKLTMKDIYTGETFILNSSLTIVATNITFSTLQQLRMKHYYNVTIEVSDNYYGSVQYGELMLSTHDIRNATVTEEDTGVTIHTDYFEHSSASGALYIFVPLDDSGAADLTGAVYLALDRNTSHNHTLPFSLSSGELAVFVYDIESDGTLASGVGYPAVSEEIFNNNTMQGQAFQPTYSHLENCNVMPSLGQVVVKCAFRGSFATGFQIIVHALDLREVYKLYINKTTDFQVSTSVLVEESGLYQVAIFPIGGVAGMIGSEVEYFRHFMVNTTVTSGITTTTTTTITTTTTAVKSTVIEPVAAEPTATGLIIGMIIVGVTLTIALLITGVVILCYLRYQKSKKQQCSSREDSSGHVFQQRSNVGDVNCIYESPDAVTINNEKIFVDDEPALYSMIAPQTPQIDEQRNNGGEFEVASVNLTLQSHDETQATRNKQRGDKIYDFPESTISGTAFQVVDAQYAEVKKPKRKKKPVDSSSEIQPHGNKPGSDESHDLLESTNRTVLQVVDAQYDEVKKPKRKKRPIDNYSEVESRGSSSTNLTYAIVDPVKRSTVEGLHEVSTGMFDDVVYSDIKPDEKVKNSSSTIQSTQELTSAPVYIQKKISR